MSKSVSAPPVLPSPRQTVVNTDTLSISPGVGLVNTALPFQNPISHKVDSPKVIVEQKAVDSSTTIQHPTSPNQQKTAKSETDQRFPVYVPPAVPANQHSVIREEEVLHEEPKNSTVREPVQQNRFLVTVGYLLFVAFLVYVRNIEYHSEDPVANILAPMLTLRQRVINNHNGLLRFAEYDEKPVIDVTAVSSASFRNLEVLQRVEKKASKLLDAAREFVSFSKKTVRSNLKGISDQFPDSQWPTYKQQAKDAIVAHVNEIAQHSTDIHDKTPVDV